ncbi:PEP-CTERM sorting domain-containing protein [Aliiroseovarius sp. S2029]|uniref:PEP-CTERM sorting domain-containing protein n=1 Tax=Aliiroseovarius sp. S2029 TaxID=2936988 RepID=UPI00200A7ABE|nr:PEP-CTERM sorting domain-containing protein [Aliiroseovarius sp. S2029]MCK8485503.1 PEP-CTERM sorting domain-containing protein [Aliiroseovarius sp. S2029]
MKQKLLIAGLACGLAVGAANAAVIDFEEYSHTAGATPTTQGDVTSMGYLFDSTTNHTHFANNFGGGDSGSTFFGSDNFAGVSSLTMSRIGGGAFNLASLDLGGWFEPSSSLQITGNLTGGGTTSVILALGAFTTYNLNWTGLSSVVFNSLAGSGDQYFGMDNIQVAAVPVPAALPLMGGALALLGFAGWRRKREDRA